LQKRDKSSSFCIICLSCVNRTAHRAHRTVKLSQDARLHSTWRVASCLFNNAKYDSWGATNVLLLHYVSISFYTLHDIAFKCPRQ